MGICCSEKQPFLPAKRTIVIASSEGFQSQIHGDSVRYSTYKSIHTFLHHCNSVLLENLLGYLLENPNLISSYFHRLNLFLRPIEHSAQTALYQKTWQPQLIFSENKVLDAFIRHKNPLSEAMLEECLNTRSDLFAEVDRIHFTANEHIDAQVLYATLVFYEQGILKTHFSRLKREVFDVISNGSCWSKAQIDLIPYLIKEHYSLEEFQSVLSKKAYFEAISLLVTLGYALDVHQLFSQQEKRNELEFIQTINNPACKKLCIIFWAKSRLGIAAYRRIVTAAQAYPLLADSLLAEEQKGTLSIQGLIKRALNPKEHQQQSLLYQFRRQFQKFGLDKTALSLLSSEELVALNTCFQVLEGARVTEAAFYSLVLPKQASGQLLRLFLPHLAAVKNQSHKEQLIHILYAGVQRGGVSQYSEVFAIKDPVLSLQAEDLLERFNCAQQLQHLQCPPELVAFAAAQDPTALKFRKIIALVEKTCSDIHENLRSVGDSSTIDKWKALDLGHRRRLYQYAYEALHNSPRYLKKQLGIEEQRVLKIIDSDNSSLLQKALLHSC